MINIIPSPYKAVEKEGTVNITNSTIVTTKFASAKAILENFLPSLGAGAGVAINILRDATLGAEEYKISICDNVINGYANSDRAAIYVAQSIIQLAGRDGVVVECDIEDKPRYQWRGFMLDSARHFWSVAQVKTVLSVMSNLKLNIFHWHLTDDQGFRIEIKKRPLLTEKGTTRSSTQLKPLSKTNDNAEYGKGLFYTQEDIKDVVKYAQSLGIDIVPEIDMPGHLVSAIACYPELSCEGKATEVSNRWGVLDNIGCCGGTALYDFIRDVLDEVCELFPFEYFHIGGDEVPKTKWKKCPKCQAKIAELGLNNEEELQGYFNNFVAEYIKPKGKKLVGWNEILNATTLSKDTIIQWWTPNSGKAKILNFLSTGGRAILSKHQNFYMDHAYAVRPLAKTYNFNYTMLGIKDEGGVIGIEAPQWTEYVKSQEKFDFNTYPRMMALAENAWTSMEKRNYVDFERRLEDNRALFENNFGVKLATPFFYRGNAIRGSFFKTERGWTAWRNDPDFELKLSKK